MADKLELTADVQKNEDLVNVLRKTETLGVGVLGRLDYFLFFLLNLLLVYIELYRRAFVDH